MTDALDVYLNQDPVGRLQEDKGKLSFTYDRAWLDSERFIPLSVTMPPQETEFTDDITRPFFDNLLPEGDVRAAIAKLKHVSAGNTLGLLGEIGGDCAGAISLWPAGEKPRDDEGYSPISDERLEAMLDAMRNRPLLAADDELRLSLAGAQDKLPLYYDGTQLHLPKGNAPSSHILKPGTPDFECMPANEVFCMKLASAAGLPVPKSDVLRKPRTVYLVQRYDRKPAENGTLVRIHQIDFCQALNFPSSKKYEHEGGPSLAACFDVITRYSAQPAKDRFNLISWTIFNFLIGNADAHAKNLSLLLTVAGISLAPFYDLVSTAADARLTEKLALKVGGENRPEWIQARHWEEFASVTGANPRIVWKRLQELADSLPKTSRDVAAMLKLETAEQALVERICSTIEARAQRLTGAVRRPA
jgi:serine/threonine-protein kinase HipA